MSGPGASPAPHVHAPASGLVVFSPLLGAWWSRFLPGPWRHCCLLLPLAARGCCGWLLLEARAGRGEASALSAEAGAVLITRLLARGCAIVPVRMEAPRKAGGGAGCVRMVRAFTALPGCWTPQGLFRVVRARKGARVFLRRA